MGRLLRSILLIVACAMVQLAQAEPLRPLTEDELTDLSISALEGSGSALRRLVNEYRRFEATVTKKAEPLSQNERALLDELVETLEAIEPKTVSGRSEWMTPTPEKPERDKPLMTPEQKEEDRRRRAEEIVPYFNFKRGATRVYSGKSRRFQRDPWTPDKKMLRIHVLEVTREKRKTVVRTLRQVTTHQDQWLAEAAFVTWTITPSQVQIGQETVFSQPVPGLILPPRDQDPRVIVKFPLRDGAVVDVYQVVTQTATVRIASVTYKNCLVVAGQTEETLFDPDLGPIRFEFFDQQWNLEREEPPPKTIPGELPKRERQILKRRLKQHCKRNRLHLEEVLDFAAVVPDGSGAPQVYVRAVVWEADKEDPDQRRYQVLRQTWSRNSESGLPVWTLLPDSR